LTNNRKRSNGTRTEQATQQQSTARNKQTNKGQEDSGIPDGKTTTGFAEGS
jgi:hypothetical protein